MCVQICVCILKKKKKEEENQHFRQALKVHPWRLMALSSSSLCSVGYDTDQIKNPLAVQQIVPTD